MSRKRMSGYFVIKLAVVAAAMYLSGLGGLHTVREDSEFGLEGDAAAAVSRHHQGGADSDPILVGAGDIGRCDSRGPELTAKLLDEIPGTIFTAGDNAYPHGRDKDFARCFEPYWGRHKKRIRPVPGNHDYHVSGATGYFRYFGKAAGDPEGGWYSYRLGEWHIVVLNSQCSRIGGCGRNSPQGRWLAADLKAHPAKCTAAILHHPLYSSGFHGGETSTRQLWDILYEAGADVVIAGHEHNYERFAGMTPYGVPNAARGIRQFIVGTGGIELRRKRRTAAGSEVFDDTSWGVLKLTLHAESYDWEFVAVEGAGFVDKGSSACH